MDPDDIAYRRSVRNMSLVLAAIVVTIFAAIFVSPYVFPPADTFQPSVTYGSAFGFTLHLQINSTSVSPGGGLLISAWLNSSSDSIASINASDSWGVGPAGLWTKPCTVGWPIGIGVMSGHYIQDNYTLGTLLPVPLPEEQCPAQPGVPGSFLLGPLSSKAVVDLNGTLKYWVLQSVYQVSTGQLPAGVYTAVLADEWGDVLTTNFIVT